MIDLMGQRFGKLLVVGRAPNNLEGRAFWHCQCDCGATKDILGKSLRQGVTTSCGCAMPALVSAQKQQDLRGQVYGRLTPIKRASTQSWLCNCSCGNTSVVPTNRLKSGNTRSCGCLRDETVEELARQRIKSPKAGDRFARLVVLDGKVHQRNNKYYYACRCDCGTELLCQASPLRTGNTRSCGCLQREKASRNGKLFGKYNRRDDGPAQFAFDPQYANRPAFVYLAEVDRRFQKIGIAFNVKERGRMSYTRIFYERQMTRASCWAVEQAVLWATRHMEPKTLPNSLTLRCGITELREGLDVERAVEMMDAMADQCERIGWAVFWEQQSLVRRSAS